VEQVMPTVLTVELELIGAAQRLEPLVNHKSELVVVGCADGRGGEFTH
jgi:hypothetical protein